MIHRISVPFGLVFAVAIVAAMATLRGDDSPALPPPRVEEVRPELFYLKTGSGGLVPVPGFRYEDFVDMLRLKEGLPRGPRPPSAVLTSVELDGTIDGAVCRATVELRVSQTEAGWASVPVGLSSMRFTKGPVHKGPGKFLLEVDTDPVPGDRPPGYRAWFEGSAGGQHVVRLEGTLPVERSAVQEAIMIDMPRATASRAVLATRMSDPVVGVSPAGGDPARIEPDGKEGGSRVELVGLAGPTRIRLAAAGAAVQVEGAAPQAVGEVIVRIDGRRAVSDVTLSLASLPADARSVRVRLPKLATVTRVEPPTAVVETAGTASDPEVLFNVERSPSGEAVVRFECETPVDASGGTPLEALAFRVDGIPDWRQWGRVSVVVSGDWQIAWGAAAGSRRVDPPKALVEGEGCVGAFEYDAQPARLPVRVTPLGSRVVVEPEYRYAVGGSRIELDARLKVSVRGAPVAGIELALEGWGIDDVGPSNLVDTAGLTGESGRLTIPFLKPLSGNATVELRAARFIGRGEERVKWTLPVPKADLVGPAVVEIVSDRDIELVPDTSGIKGLVRQITASSAPRDPELQSPVSRDAQALAYRLDGTVGTFEATRRFLPRRVDASVSTRVVVDRSDIVVDETLRFDVAHVPLESVSLVVPRGVFESGGLEIRQNEQLLTPISDGRERGSPAEDAGEEDDSKPSSLTLQVPLASPLLGTGELRLRYSAKTPDVPDEASVPEDLPIVLPADVRVARQSFAAESQAGIAVDVRGEQWKRDAASGMTTSARSWTSAKPQDAVPMALSAERQTASASSIVEAAWFETRLLPDRREDLFRYRIETAAPSIAVTLPSSSLPAGTTAGAIEVRLDGRSIAGEVQPGGRLVVDLSGGGTSGGHLLEIDRVQPRQGLFEPLVLDAPQFGERTIQRRFYWEVRLESNDHVIVPPGRWTSQQRWVWSALGLVRQPIVSRETLGRWLAGNLVPQKGSREPQTVPPVAERRFVYSGVGWPGREQAWLAPTWLVVLCVSGPVLLASLLAIYRPAVRNAPMAIATAAALVAVSVLVPDQIPLLAQGAIPGLVLAVLAGGLRAAFRSERVRAAPNYQQSVIISGGSTRTTAPAPVVAAADSRSETRSFVRLVLLATMAAAAATARADGPQTSEEDRAIRFLRFHVPKAAVTAEFLGEGRYVPMPVAEFDAAVARGTAEAAVARATRAVRSSYRLSWQPGKGLAGSLEFEIDSSFDALPVAMRLFGPTFSGRCRVDQAVVESPAGTGAATVAGMADGSTAVIARERGVHRCGWRFDSAVGDPLPGLPSPGEPRSERFVMPLVPSLATTIHVSCPPGFRPVFDGAWARAVDDPSASGRTYVVDIGPVDVAGIVFVPTAAPATPLSIANRVSMSRRVFSVAAEVRPRRRWDSKSFVVELDRGLTVTDVSMGGLGEASALSWTPSTGRTVQVVLPDRCSGGDMPVVVKAIAAVERPEGMPVPVVRPLRDAWAGGTVSVKLDDVTMFTSIAVQEGVLVDRDAEADRDGSPMVVMEQQSPGASLRISVSARPAELDIARVTTVDISTGAVTGRAAANVVVRRGEAFELEGRIAAGWIVDAVELAGEHRVPEWGVETDGDGAVLRIGLVEGGRPGSALDLRIVGHRPALPQERSFPSTDLDMVRLRGETESQSIIDIRANAETTLLVGGLAEVAVPAAELSDRLRRLAETGSPRARVAAGTLAQPSEITILRRRPPVDVKTQIRLTVRDDRVSESFSFECSPRTAEIDSLLVHFSEPTDGQLEWTVLAPGNAKVAARRADAGVRRGESPGQSGPAAETWLLEISPPVRETITLRGSRSGPFREARRGCLAWVEGAPARIGEVFIRDAGRIRPTIGDCRLPEIPSPQLTPDKNAAAIASFGFDVDRDLRSEGAIAFELVPGVDDAAAARAWAWSETTTAWCHESGWIEYETRFLIENHGRRTAMLEVPPDKRLESVRLDDARLDVAGVEAGGIQFPIELPAGRRFVRLDVRLVAQRRPAAGFLGVDAGGGRLDMPAMERVWNVAIPPELEIAFRSSSHRQVGIPDRSWAQRLLGFPPVAERSAGSPMAGRDVVADDPGHEGFTMLRFVPADSRAASGTVTLVRRSLVERGVILVGTIAAVVAFVIAARQPVAMVVMVAVCGLFTLWGSPPWDGLFRAALWGGLGAGAVAATLEAMHHARGARTRPVGAHAGVVSAVCGLTMALFGPAGTSLGADPIAPARVFITPGDSGGVALVPEKLFRAIAAVEGDRRANVSGTINVRVFARPPREGAEAAATAWTLEMDVEGQGGEVFVVEQGISGGRFVPGTATLDGRAVSDVVAEDGRALRIGLPGFGRHGIRVDVLPRVTARGEAFEATIDMPAAADSRLVIPRTASGPGRSPFDCERASSTRSNASVWRFAQAIDDGDPDTASFDLTGAAATRLVWPASESVVIARRPAAVRCRNDIVWGERETGEDGPAGFGHPSECLVRLRLDMKAADGDADRRTLVPAVWVEIDPRLEPPDEAVASEAGVAFERVDAGTARIVWRSQKPGQRSVTLPFRMPLERPVGVFEVPLIRPANGTDGTVEVRLRTPSRFRVRAELPESVSPIQPGPQDGAGRFVGWIANDRMDRVSINVTRRESPLEAAQDLAVAFEPDRIRLSLRARIDSIDSALPELRVALPKGFLLDGVRLSAIDAAGPSDAPHQPLDIRFLRGQDDRVIVVPQGPRAGRFSLELDARLQGPPAARGALPVARLEDPATSPLAITWTAPQNLLVTVEAADGRKFAESCDLPAEVAPPAYRFGPRRSSGDDERGSNATAVEPPVASEERSDVATDDTPVPDMPAGIGRARVELADIRIAIDDRGRAWGVARFELMAGSPRVRIRLPHATRLFEAFVDDHPVPATPADDDTWEIALLDISRPRSVVAVFAGDLGDRVGSGAAIEVASPSIESMPARNVLWTIRGPRDRTIRLLPGSHATSAEQLAAMRRAAVERLTPDVVHGFESRNPDEQARIRMFLDRGESVEGFSPESLWERSRSGLAPDAYVAADAGDSAVRFRVARPVDVTLPGRVLGTLALVVAAAVVWTFSRRPPPPRSPVSGL